MTRSHVLMNIPKTRSHEYESWKHFDGLGPSCTNPVQSKLPVYNGTKSAVSMVTIIDRILCSVRDRYCTYDTNLSVKRHSCTTEGFFCGIAITHLL